MPSVRVWQMPISKNFNIKLDEKYHQYLVNGHYYDSVTSILKTMGLYDCYGRVPDQELMAAKMKKGKAVHRATELFDKDELDETTLHPTLIPYLEAWKKFKATFQPTWYHIEAGVASVKYTYAGTIDRVGLIKGTPWIIDIKASESTIPATKLQLAGYDIAYHEMVGEKGTYKRAAVLLSGKTGDYNFIPYESTFDYNAFLGMLQFYFWKRKERLCE